MASLFHMKPSLLYALLILLLYSCGGGNSTPATTPAAKTDTKAGEELFNANCYQCHRAGSELLGPNLAGVRDRWADRNELYAFIRNPQEVIARNKYARDLQQKYNGTIMLPYPNLSQEQVNAILDYCDQAGNKN